MPCRHHDVQVFDGLRCCLACGETVFDLVTHPKAELPRSQNTLCEYAHLNYSLGQEIRLCVLFPARNTTEGVVVDLVHVNIRDHPSYEAISYSWATQEGDASLSQTVLCHGGIIPVTKTCEAALRRLRLSGRNRYLWVDALCIDQSNVEERNHQVGLMGTIYASASQVIIYLGPGTPATDRMLNYLNKEESDSDKHIVIHSVVREFLDHRWFDRVWILQEIALARLAIMIVGKKTTHWTLQAINKVLRLCGGQPPPSALRWIPASQPERDVLSVLQRSRNCSSTDPRDKVYAVLGLARADFRERFPIDYSLTADDVYMELATHMIDFDQNLHVLKFASGQITSSRRVRDLPSWVPQWDIKDGYDPLPPQFTHDELKTLASVWFTPSLESYQHETVSCNTLLQTFLEILPKDQPPMPTAAWLQAFSYWLDLTKATRSESDRHPTISLRAAALCITRIRAPDFHFSISPKETNKDSLSEKNELSDCDALPPSPIWRCLRVRAHELGRVNGDEKSVPEGRKRLHRTHRFLPALFDDYSVCTKCRRDLPMRVCQVTSAMHPTTSKYAKNMEEVFSGTMTIFYTQWSIGGTRARVQYGDSIWALDGADVPIVLRKVGGHYVFIGECFLYWPTLCTCCGCKLDDWPIVTQIIDIW
jgi:hypothetical protein